MCECFLFPLFFSSFFIFLFFILFYFITLFLWFPLLSRILNTDNEFSRFD